MLVLPPPVADAIAPGAREPGFYRARVKHLFFNARWEVIELLPNGHVWYPGHSRRQGVQILEWGEPVDVPGGYAAPPGSAEV
jgi:hypothetical protein